MRDIVGRLHRAWLRVDYMLAEMSYVAYRGPHGYRLNAVAARKEKRWLDARGSKTS